MKRAPGVNPLIILLLVLCAAFPPSPRPAAADPPPSRNDQASSSGASVPHPPLRFDSECVRLEVRGDTLFVEGTYLFLCAPQASPEMTLFYPFPEDSLLGAATMTSLACRPAGGARDWTAARFQQVPQRPGARWWIPLDLADSLEVRARYRQVLHGAYARYIVTSTAAWGQPLQQARFEISLPEDVRAVRCSFPFERESSAEGTVYVYQAQRFMPDRDIVVTWER